ncbi:MAG TPA: cytosine permease [Rhizomicrobium sp.]|nr:cytosine permease [Rhizomicrobium sp.]
MEIEKYNIGFVPLGERYGSEKRLFTIWFSINLSIVCLTVGTLGILAGLGFTETALALVLGNAIGTIFMAAHSAQGPHLGIPQMIQSRAQFGVFGAAIPLVAVIITYMLYLAADEVVIRRTLTSLIPVGTDAAMIAFAAAILLVAYIGYELIHRLGVYLTVLSGLMFLATAALLITHKGQAAAVTAPAVGRAEFAAFMATLTQATAWSLTFGPYVADYSRYLRPDVPTASTFWYTAMGNFLGASAIMCLGAYMASHYAQIAADPGVGIAGLFGPVAPVVKGLIVLGVFQAGVMNLYSAFMSASTIVSGFNRYGHISPRAKFVIMAGVMTLATAIAILTQNNFHRYFGDMLDMMVYVLVPWSAINLADYYVVRGGSYEIDDMFNPGGIYGRFHWPTIIIYGLSIVVEAPFARLSFYTGPIAEKVGADIAWLPGLIVPAILYCSIMRNRTVTKSA